MAKTKAKPAVVKKDIQKSDVAAATLTGVRQPYSETITHGLTPQRLAAVLRAGEHGDIHDYFVMAEELEEKDPHYQAVMGVRKRAVTQLDITVEPGDESEEASRHADFVRDFLARETLEEELFDILDAIGKGYSVTEINWEFIDGHLVPSELKWRDPTWFELDPYDLETLYLRDGAERTPLAWGKFIVHRHKAKSGLSIRGGVAKAVVWSWMFKNFSVKNWVVFSEVYGQPLRLGKYQTSATEEEKATLLRAVAGLGTDAAAIIPESMIVEFVEAASSGNVDLYARLANFMDQQISKAVLGQTTTTDAIGGGHAVSKEHNEVREDIEKADAKQLAATLNQQLIRPLIEINFGPQKRYPKISLGRAEHTDIVQLTTALGTLIPQGLKVSMSDVRNKLGFKEPEDEADLMQPFGRTPQEASPPDAEDPALAAQSGQLPDNYLPATPVDEIERFVKEDLPVIGNDIMEPILAPLLGAIEDASSLEEARDRLLLILEEMDTEQLQEHLAGAKVFVRTTAEVGADE